MLIRGVRFNYCFDQSGVRNFFGEGYPYHRPFKLFPGFRFDDCTFVAKTTTLEPRRGKAYQEGGNMSLESDFVTPAEFKPACISVTPRSFLQGAALNAVGLSGPGVEGLLSTGKWQEYPRPFMISVMTVTKTPFAELYTLVKLIKQHQPFRAKFGVQLNKSCPNVEHAQAVADVVKDTRMDLAILRDALGSRVPLVVKLNALFPVSAAKDMADDRNCDGICNSNTIPWKDVPEVVRRELFKTEISPLDHLGGGGLSGAYWLFRLVENWMIQARAAGIKKPIIAGGGILKAAHVDRLAQAGASAVAVGSVAFLRPWRVGSIIERANAIGNGMVPTADFYRAHPAYEAA